MKFVYVSSVEGRLVPRFPTIGASVTQFIGATRYGKSIVWNPAKVVPIPEAEWDYYRREYTRRIADGSLVVRTEEEFKVQRAAEDGAQPPPAPELTPDVTPQDDTAAEAAGGEPSKSSPTKQSKKKAARAAGEGDKA